MWSRCVGTAAEMMPVPLAAGVFGPAASGLLGLAQRIVGLPIRFLGISAAQAYVSELVSLERGDTDTLRALFRETALRLLVAGAAYLAVVLLLGPRLFALAFGPAWAESGAMAQLLAPMYLAMFVNRPVRYTIQFYERQDLGLLVNAASLAVVAAAFSLAHLGLLTLPAAVAAMSGGLCLTNLISFLVARALIDGRLPAGRAPPDGEGAAAVGRGAAREEAR
jgi:O-antigen/teichoic acid export membrane protein